MRFPIKQKEIQSTLMNFNYQTLSEAAIGFFNTLGYDSPKKRFSENNLPLFERSDKNCRCLFQLTQEELPLILSGKKLSLPDQDIDLQKKDSLLFIAIEIKKWILSAEEMIKMADEISKNLVMPAIFLFRYENLLTLLITKESNPEKKEVHTVLLRNFRIIHPTYPQTEILFNLHTDNLTNRQNITSCKQLFDKWFEVLLTYKRDEKTFLQKAGILVFI